MLQHKSLTIIFSIYSIFYIGTFYNMPSQAEGRESTRSMKRKAVNGAIGSGSVKTSASWSWEEIKRI
jgi:hypothetical protein